MYTIRLKEEVYPKKKKSLKKEKIVAVGIFEKEA